jgi:hypothetical protein
MKKGDRGLGAPAGCDRTRTGRHLIAVIEMSLSSWLVQQALLLNLFIIDEAPCRDVTRPARWAELACPSSVREPSSRVVALFSLD